MVAEIGFQAATLVDLESALSAQPQVQMKLSHRFTCDPETKAILYIREVELPAGAIFVTKIHRKEHPFVISKGRVAIVDSFGNRTEIVAPFTGVTQPGTKRAILVMEETIWTTFHMTDTTDLAEIERQVIISEPSPLIADGSSCLPADQPVAYLSPNIKESLCPGD